MRPYLPTNHKQPRIRHPALSQSTHLCFFSPPLTLFSQFPRLLFILSEILFQRPTPRGGSGYHLLVCASQSVFVSPKALVLVYPELVCHAIVCYSFIHKIHNAGGNPSTSEAILHMAMSVFALNRSVSRLWSPLNLSSVERLLDKEHESVSYLGMCADVPLQV